jgi:hypothetical protein
MQRHFALAIIFLMTLLISVVNTESVFAQFNIQHQAPTVIVTGEETTLEFLVPGITQDQVSSATLFSRTDGELSYNQQESLLQNGSFFFQVRVDAANANTFEYYLVIQLINGSELTFPEANFIENPVQIPVVGEAEEEEPEYEALTGVDYTILSPEEGLAYSQDDMVLAIALFYDPDLIEPGEFRIMLDNKDVTADADTSAYFLTYAPKKIRLGTHRFSIDYVTENTIYRLTSWSFNVVDPSQASFSGFTERTLPRGNVELTARNQVIAGDVNDALTGLVRVSGNQGYLNYSVNGFLTSQESSRLQPQNRFGVDLNYGKWIRLQGGHIFPTVSNLSMNGRRVFGLNTSVHLADENLNLQFLFGELSREITNRYGSLNRNEITAPDGSVVDTTYTLGFENQGQGTFRRQIVGGRVGFGNPDRFQFGIHALKVQDDTTSIRNIGDFTSLQNFRPDLVSGLSADDVSKLNNQPDILQVDGGNPRARGNLVAGTDLQFSADQNRIRFNGELTAGVLNNDISGGALTVQRADELGFDIDQADADLLDRLSRFIIINENMSNLPLRIRENAQGDNETEFFFPTAVLAGNSQASFNYLNNNLRIQYQWIGPDYTSLANNTIRRDVAGFTISDRIRMFENRIFLTLGYESLDDNVVGNLEATTTTNTIRTNLSWYPIDRLLPRVSVGIRLRSRDNGVARFNPNIGSDILNASVQNFRIVNGDTLGAPVARSNQTFNFSSSVTKQFDAFESRHDVSLNLNTLRTRDDVFEFGDTRSLSLSLNLNSRFSQLPLNTQLGMNVNNTETTSGLSDFKIFGIFAGGTYFLMENRLSLNGQVALTNNINVNQSLRINDNGTAGFSGDDYYEADPGQIQRNEFSTFVFRMGAEFTIDQYQALIFDANFNNVSLAGTANDRIVQLRYVFRF